LARPNDLHGPIDMLGYLDRPNDAIDLQAPAKAAAEQMIVDNDLVEREARCLGRSSLGAPDVLAADPDLAAVPADMNRAIHRLHRGVSQEWNLISSLDPDGSVRHGLVGISNILRHRARAERRLFELARDLFGGKFCVRAIVPLDLERR